MVGKTAPITDADERRFDAITEIGCIPCMIEGIAGTPAEVNHATVCGRRVSSPHRSEHQNTYGACAYHHRAVHNGKLSLAELSRRCGPSLALNRRDYHDRYGSELELVQLQDALIRTWLRARREGRYLSPSRWVRLTRALHAHVMAHRQSEVDG